MSRSAHPSSSAADPKNATGDPGCSVCADLLANGRSGPTIHCRDCHLSWTGNEAQHCLRCHRTFVSIAVADAHRFRREPDGRFVDDCINPAAAGWREKRSNVWTNSAEMTAEAKASFGDRP